MLRDRSLEKHAELLHDGIAQLKAINADVVLMDLQYSPAVIAKSETDGMVEQIALAAKAENVDLFERFAIMRNWSEVQHLSFDTFVAPDQLHMNDWGYGCVAKLLAAAIAEAATRPITSAAAHRDAGRHAGEARYAVKGHLLFRSLERRASDAKRQSYRLERREHVFDDIVGMFEPAGDTHQAVADAKLGTLRRRQPLMRCRGNGRSRRPAGSDARQDRSRSARCSASTPT